MRGRAGISAIAKDISIAKDLPIAKVTALWRNVQYVVTIYYHQIVYGKLLELYIITK